MRCDEDETVESIIKVLLAYGADSSQNDTSGNSCLHFACTLGRISCIEAYLKHLPALKDAPMAAKLAVYKAVEASPLHDTELALEGALDTLGEDLSEAAAVEQLADEEALRPIKRTQTTAPLPIRVPVRTVVEGAKEAEAVEVAEAAEWQLSDSHRSSKLELNVRPNLF